MDIQGEALLAVIGFDALIKPGRLRVTVDQRQQAARWASGALLKREIRRFLTAEAWDKPAPLPAFDYMDVLEDLSNGVDVATIQEKFADNDVDESVGLVFAAGEALRYLSDVIPKRSRVTTMGPKPVPPSDADVAKFRRAHATVQRPMLVFDDLNEGALGPDQVKAFAAVYPALYDATKSAVFEVLVDIKASRPKWEIPSKRDKQLQVLMQTRTVTPELLGELQKSFEIGDQGEGEAPQKRPLNINADSMNSPIQRAQYK